MKSLITTTAILCAVAPFQMMDNITTWMLKTHCEMFNMTDDSGYDWILSDSILGSKLLTEFPVNEKADTIYIDHACSAEDQGILIWNSVGVLKLILDPNKIIYSENQSKKTIYQSLVASWETDLLKQISKETGLVSPTMSHFLTRIILKNGASKIDTTKFGTIYTIPTGLNIDSLREVVRQKKLAVTEQTEQIDTTLRRDSVAQISVAPDDSQQQVEEQPRSLWQRIADWFCRLWHRIFG